MSEFKSRSHVVYSAKWHLIWTLKYRCAVLDGGVDVRLKEIIGQVCSDMGAEVIEVEVMADHVHLLVEVPPQVPIPRFVKFLKGRSARLLGQEFPRLGRLPSLWMRSYFCSTVGGAPLDVVRRYVENQKRIA